MIAVALSRPPNFDAFSWGIRKVTHSDVSHSSVHFHDADGTLGGDEWVYEAGGHGVILKSRKKWVESNDARYIFTLKRNLDAHIGYPALKSAFRELGDEYDKAGVARFAIYLILNRLSHSLAERVVRNTQDKLFCSEAVFRVLQWMSMLADGEGFEPLGGMQPELVSPEDLKVALRRCDAFEVTYANPGSL